MNIHPRISRLAITSLVLGMAFYIPLVTGILALTTGIIAIALIKNSKGKLLGKGLAFSGAILGVIHATFWVLFLFVGLIFSIDIGYTGVVIRDNEPVRIAEFGIHYKIPLIEHVEKFPTAELFSLKNSPGRLFFKSRKFSEVHVELFWQVCDPMRTYNKIRRFDKSIIEMRLDQFVKDTMRMAAVNSDNVTELINNSDIPQKELEYDFKEYGLCLNSFNILPGAEEAPSLNE